MSRTWSVRGWIRHFALSLTNSAQKKRYDGRRQAGHFVLWADEAEDEERSPDSDRETSQEQGRIKRYP
jgi:hypothetical protein